ncbi:MAG: hypothetical protein JO295_12890, partial [Verrucomicrobia bacterium]|nr:hypothetical protein [Verrucomicrobiota bacterium]
MKPAPNFPADLLPPQQAASRVSATMGLECHIANNGGAARSLPEVFASVRVPPAGAP